MRQYYYHAITHDVHSMESKLTQKHAVDWMEDGKRCMGIREPVAGWSYGNLRKTLSYGITTNPQVDDYSLVLQI